VKRVLLALGLGFVAGFACTPEVPPDPPEEAEEPYDGPTAPSIIPSLDPDDLDRDAGDVVVDAGMVVVNTECCEASFSISDQEPADAVGYLDGELPVFQGGLPLTRTDGGWATSACIPVNAATRYWYRFSFDGGTEDAGEVDLEDGGLGILINPITTTVVRTSDREPTVTNAEGSQNYYDAVTSCDGG
jgi:hypothetical protein